MSTSVRNVDRIYTNWAVEIKGNSHPFPYTPISVVFSSCADAVDIASQGG